MPAMGKDVLGKDACKLNVEFEGNNVYRARACQDLEVISEAIKVIYAFAAELEPAEVSSQRWARTGGGQSLSTSGEYRSWGRALPPIDSDHSCLAPPRSQSARSAAVLRVSM